MPMPMPMPCHAMPSTWDAMPSCNLLPCKDCFPRRRRRRHRDMKCAEADTCIVVHGILRPGIPESWHPREPGRQGPARSSTWAVSRVSWCAERSPGRAGVETPARSRSVKDKFAGCYNKALASNFGEKLPTTTLYDGKDAHAVFGRPIAVGFRRSVVCRQWSEGLGDGQCYAALAMLWLTQRPERLTRAVSSIFGPPFLSRPRPRRASAPRPMKSRGAAERSTDLASRPPSMMASTPSAMLFPAQGCTWVQSPGPWPGLRSRAVSFPIALVVNHWSGVSV
jgi:hypothetical protein